MSQQADTITDVEFADLTEPFRRELLAHCYRMLGSVDDAEDVVQESYLRAWRSYRGFEGRSSVRTWLYQIATNTCLTARQHRTRRALPSGLGGPGEDHETGSEFGWLQPMPDALVTGEADDPAVIAVTRDSLRLALIASFQYLPPRQRAVLLLREVLAFPAEDVARMLGTTTVAVKSALQRARARLSDVAPAGRQLASRPSQPPAPCSTRTSPRSSTPTRRPWSGCCAGTPRWSCRRRRSGSRAARPSPPRWPASARRASGGWCPPRPTGSPPRPPTSGEPTASTGRSGSWCSPPPPRASPVSWCSGTRGCWAGSGSRRPGGEPVDNAPRVTEMRLVVTASDYEEALRFYRDVLGLPERAAYSSPAGRVTILEAGRATLELADPPHAAYIDEVEVGRRVAGHIRLAFAVADSATTTGELAAAGATVIAEPTRTPWASLNARLDAPADLQLTLFTDDPA